MVTVRVRVAVEAWRVVGGPGLRWHLLDQLDLVRVRVGVRVGVGDRVRARARARVKLGWVG